MDFKKEAILMLVLFLSVIAIGFIAALIVPILK
jgi:hypothetical protein